MSISTISLQYTLFYSKLILKEYIRSKILKEELFVIICLVYNLSVLDELYKNKYIFRVLKYVHKTRYKKKFNVSSFNIIKQLFELENILYMYANFVN